MGQVTGRPVLFNGGLPVPICPIKIEVVFREDQRPGLPGRPAFMGEASGILYNEYMASLDHLVPVWIHLCLFLYVNSPLEKVKIDQKSPRQIPGLPGVFHIVYLASLSHLEPVRTHLCQRL